MWCTYLMHGDVCGLALSTTLPCGYTNVNPKRSPHVCMITSMNSFKHWSSTAVEKGETCLYALLQCVKLCVGSPPMPFSHNWLSLFCVCQIRIGFVYKFVVGGSRCGATTVLHAVCPHHLISFSLTHTLHPSLSPCLALSVSLPLPISPSLSIPSLSKLISVVE